MRGHKIKITSILAHDNNFGFPLTVTTVSSMGNQITSQFPNNNIEFELPLHCGDVTITNSFFNIEISEASNEELKEIAR